MICILSASIANIPCQMDSQQGSGFVWNPNMAIVFRSNRASVAPQALTI